jgi:hypothetical protein
MNLTEEIWDAINATPSLPQASKKALHVSIIRLIEESRKPTGNRLGVTIMTQEASLAGDAVAADRKKEQDPTAPKPKSL